MFCSILNVLNDFFLYSPSKKNKALVNNPTRLAIEGLDVLPTLPSGKKDWVSVTMCNILQHYIYRLYYHLT